MKYFKNTELAKLYHISEKSVRNWIDATNQGKLDLQLYDQEGRVYIANTSKNTVLIEALVKRGKKYKNSRSLKTLTPKKEFYELYNQKQIFDIISNITIHKETPLQYTYVDGGAEDWDKYASRLLAEGTSNILTSTIKTLDLSASSFDLLLKDYKKINVIDLGPGNGLPIRTTLERLLADGRLGKYIPVDISDDMMHVLQRNLAEWFGDKIEVEPLLKDISYERFNDYMSSNFTDASTANMVFLLGGTLANFRAPEQVLQVINDSMGVDDLFIYSGYLDTVKNRRYFDYYTSDRKVPAQDGLILDLLNIDESLYDVEQVFNEQERARSISIVLKVDMGIDFQLGNGVRHIELRKGEHILIWRHWHKTLVELVNQFDRGGFSIMQASKSPDQEYAVVVSRIKTGE